MQGVGWAYFALALGFACAAGMGAAMGKRAGPFQSAVLARVDSLPPRSGQESQATFAAGCFWGVQLAFQRLPGVLTTKVGYTAGKREEPTYEEVCSGKTGHTEAVQMTFDPAQISFRDLCRVFFEIHDATQLNRQGNDRGTQYRSGIYTHNDSQQAEALEEKAKHEQAIVKRVVTEVQRAGKFWDAEEYHQNYLVKGGQTGKKGSDKAIRCYG